ncbi:putative polysaccharide biosynthesis protein [Metabacillus iocasae]|uniref:PST family polysaccharide transporter n=1 Tax=Priestia iocasae TaxID=2291674 RepID=A0ABS2QZJ7_9BACI|nr:polysaccharide biosynthesis protein [Metabacillus iocasae]MBM7704908.1 PST family polysaccharide transporter [Metabacillus iocasae]
MNKEVKNSHVQSILNGALILTLAGLFTKVLSASYRIPYHYIAGDVGFYIYQQVYPLYGISLLLGTYGFPVIISKLIAENRHNKRVISLILRTSFMLLSLMNGLFFALQYLFAEQIASWMGDDKLTPLIQIISLSFLFIPFLAVIRGYYQGINNMVPTALSQVAEQMVRVGTILLLSFLLLHQGYDLYVAGAGAIFGSITGAITSLFVLGAFLLKHKKRLPIRGQYQITDEVSAVLKKVALQGSLICLSGMGLLFIQLVDSFTLFSQLVLEGTGELKAKIMKGTYDRGLPLIQLGTVVGTAFSLALVPVISSAVSNRDQKLMREKSRLSLKLSLVVGIGAAMGLVGIMQSTNAMLYGDIKGTDTLQILSLLIVFTTLSATTAAILHGMGYMYVPALAVLGGLVLKYVLNIALIAVYETEGAAIASVLSFAFIAGVNTLYLRLKIRMSMIGGKSIGSILMAACVMLVVLKLYELGAYSLVEANNRHTTFYSSQALSAVCLGGVLYIYLILRNGVFTLNELLDIPLGDKVAKYIEKNKNKGDKK